MAVCNCSGEQRPWHSCLASSAAVCFAFSYSESVMISLLTRAMISSMVLPALGSTGCAAAPFSFGAGGLTGFGCEAAGEAAGGGACELDSCDCAPTDMPVSSTAAHNPTIIVSFLMLP